MNKPNVIDWLRETAAFMTIDRPDVYTQESAIAVLDKYMTMLRDNDEGPGMISMASYFLIRYVEDGVEEFDVAKKITSVSNYKGEPGVWACAYTKDSGVLKYGVENLPDVLDDDDEDFAIDDDD